MVEQQLREQLEELQKDIENKNAIIAAGNELVVSLNKNIIDLRKALAFTEVEYRKLGREDLAERAAILAERG